MTWALDRLGAAGFVRRGLDQRDRRKVSVELTEEVARRARPVCEPLLEVTNALLAGFDHDDLETVIAFVTGTREILARHTAMARESRHQGNPR